MAASAWSICQPKSTFHSHLPTPPPLHACCTQQLRLLSRPKSASRHARHARGSPFITARHAALQMDPRCIVCLVLPLVLQLLGISSGAYQQCADSCSNWWLCAVVSFGSGDSMSRTCQHRWLCSSVVATHCLSFACAGLHVAEGVMLAQRLCTCLTTVALPTSSRLACLDGVSQAAWQ